ncbi:MAG: hypothetical protein U0176_17050 [Bacteroidia bacterium]
MKFDINDLPGGPFESLEDLNKALAAHFETVNNRPIADFHGLSPSQMHNLLRKTFEPESPIRMKEVTAEQAERSPFYRLVVDLLTTAQTAGGFKATAKGNLPTTVCKELYAKRHILLEMIEIGIVKPYKEDDYQSINAAHVVCKQIGLLRKFKGKILLTKKGEKLLQPTNRPELFRELLVGYCLSFNWGYLDGVQVDGLTQWELGFLLFLLIKYGNEERKATYYAEQCLLAFPIMKERLVSPYHSPLEELSHATEIRFFGHFACWFGLAEDTLVEKKSYLDRSIYRKTALLDGLFEVRG